MHNQTHVQVTFVSSCNSLKLNKINILCSLYSVFRENKVFEERYFHNASLLQVSIGRRPSYAWKGFMEVGIFLHEGFTWKKGNKGRAQGNFQNSQRGISAKEAFLITYNPSPHLRKTLFPLHLLSPLLHTPSFQRHSLCLYLGLACSVTKYSSHSISSLFSIL